MKGEIYCSHRWHLETYWSGFDPKDSKQHYNSRCRRCDTLLEDVKKEQDDLEPRVVIGYLELKEGT